MEMSERENSGGRCESRTPAVSFYPPWSFYAAGRLTACAITRFELAKEWLVVRLLIPLLLLAYSADHGFSDRGATRSRAPQKRQVQTDGGACFHRVHVRLLLTTHNSD